MSPLVEKGYSEAHEIVAQANSNLTTFFGVLSAEKQAAMLVFYAFCRRTDDIADSEKEESAKLEEYQEWFACIREALSGRTTEVPLAAALRHVVEKFEIPQQYVFDVLRGVSQDIGSVEMETVSELRTYCYLVASAVGLASLRIWGVKGEQDEYLRPAIDCGIAMQITNILRDAHEDLRNRRIYFPKEDYRPRGLNLDNPVQPIDNERWKDLVQFESRRAQNLFHSGLKLQRFLDPRGKKLLLGMIGRYWALLKKIRRNSSLVLRERIVLSPFEKFKINAQTVLGFPRLKIPQA